MKRIKEVSAMDNSKSVDILAQLGEKAAAIQIKDNHILQVFDLNRDPDLRKKRFTQNKDFDLDFNAYVKNPDPIQAVQIHEDFEVETMEGIMQGKAGDYLMKGIRGELYVCDQEIFKQSYSPKK
jgi:hypothetical protein